MTPRLSAALALAALIAGCGSQPVPYDSYEAMAAKLKGTAAECQSLEQAPLKEFDLADERYNCATRSGTIVLAKYLLPKIREEDQAKWKGKLVVGPNWIVDVTAAPALAETVADTLNGETS
ncbi:hypothetical protein [Nonomuraea sp. NPDC005650]|uniref:hypothetical protein n=1 Tax=Nonomuraea sp. NPDC005650 TaxID=3157045 RepID=UPI0033AD823C